MKDLIIKQALKILKKVELEIEELQFEIQRARIKIIK